MEGNGGNGTKLAERTERNKMNGTNRKRFFRNLQSPFVVDVVVVVVVVVVRRRRYRRWAIVTFRIKEGLSRRLQAPQGGAKSHCSSSNDRCHQLLSSCFVSLPALTKKYARR